MYLTATAVTVYFKVKSVQNYTVFAAMNGAGLMNSIYLPKDSTTIQMVPYRAGVNVRQYGQVLKHRGPYMEWMNPHEHLHHQAQRNVTKTTRFNHI